jgi:integrase
MGHIRKHPRSQRWQVRYRDPTGRERSRTFRKRTDADAFLVTIEADKVRGTWLDPNHGLIPFGEWWARWHAGRVNLRPSSRNRDDSYWQSFIAPTLANEPIGAIRPDLLRGWIAHLLDRGAAPATIRKAAQLVKAALEAAVDDGLIGSNPARKLPLPSIPPTEMRFASTNEIRRLSEAIDRRWRVMVLTAAYTGLRMGEITGLTVDQVNLLGRRLTVTKQLTESNGHIEFGPVKTQASRRTVTLPRFLCDELAQHLTDYPPSHDGLVFQAADGGPIRRSNWRRRVWIPAVKEADMAGFRFHDLRHTHAALLIAQGEHPKVIQSRLGHASITTTLNTYGHLFEGLDKAAADRLHDSWLAPSGLEAAADVVNLA